MAKTGNINISVRSRKKALATSFARKIANGSLTDKRNALSVSLFCSRKKHGCSIREAAKRNASQSRPGPNRRDSLAEGSNVKLKSTTTVRMNTTVVVRSSRERNSVRSSLPSRAEAVESSVIQAFANRRESSLDPDVRECLNDAAFHCFGSARQGKQRHSGIRER